MLVGRGNKNILSDFSSMKCVCVSTEYTRQVVILQGNTRTYNWIGSSNLMASDKIPNSNIISQGNAKMANSNAQYKVLKSLENEEVGT